MNEIIYLGSLSNYREASMVVGTMGVTPTVKENHGKGTCVLVRKRYEGCGERTADTLDNKRDGNV